MATSNFDVIISGGGLSGLLTAIGLANETPDLSIAIVEPFDKQQTSDTKPSLIKPSFDDRCLALSYGSLQLMNTWHIWSNLKPNAWPIQTIVTSDRGHIGKTIMRAGDYQLNAMGYVAAMHNIGVAFEATLAYLTKTTQNNVSWFKPAKIDDIKQEAEQVQVVLNTGEQLTAKLLVVAEGGNSLSRELLNIGTSKSQYEQCAIITNIEVEQQNRLDKTLQRKGEDAVSGNTAFERFTTSGPIAFLPIAKDQYSVVWSVKPDEVDHIMQLEQAEFCTQLQQAFGYSAGKILNTSKREVYPLSLIKAERLTGHRVALVGNCAHSVHPIAGQGFNLGLRDIAVLVHQISKAVNQKEDIGAFDVLNTYEKLREPDIKRITDFTDLLVRIFGLEGRLPALTRTTGLMALQKVDCLQQWLALHFMSSKKLSGLDVS